MEKTGPAQEGVKNPPGEGALPDNTARTQSNVIEGKFGKRPPPLWTPEEERILAEAVKRAERMSW